MKKLLIILMMITSIWASDYKVIIINEPNCADCVDLSKAMQENKMFQLFLRENDIGFVEYNTTIPDEYVTSFYPTIYMVDAFGIPFSTLYGYVEPEAIMVDMTEKFKNDSITDNR